MVKTYILDTNVFLHDGEAISKFEENTIIIPLVVLEELDKFKKEIDEKGRNARYVNRRLDELRSRGSLAAGVKLESGGTLRIDMACRPSPAAVALDPTINDHQILFCAKAIKDAILVTKDINLRIKADVLGVRAEDYENDKVAAGDGLYSGQGELQADSNFIDRLHLEGEMPLSEFYGSGYLPNQFLTVTSNQNPKHTCLARVTSDGWSIKKVSSKLSAYGIEPRNREQLFALDLLLDPGVSLVTISAKAGCGKTLLAIAAGLAQVDAKRYKRLLVSRPVVPMGREIGFLPGDLEEKMAPFMAPIKDNIEQIVRYGDEDDIEEKRPGRRKPSTKPQEPGVKLSAMDELKMQGLLEVNALTFIRGRSIPKQFMLIDESQNISAHEAKTIVTRAGEGTKIVFTGDPDQLDNPYLDSCNNGLVYLVNKMKGQGLYGHITLTKGERSELAELAANIL